MEGDHWAGLGDRGAHRSQAPDPRNGRGSRIGLPHRAFHRWQSARCVINSVLGCLADRRLGRLRARRPRTLAAWLRGRRAPALTPRARPAMLTDTSWWSHTPGNAVVPSRWHATARSLRVSQPAPEPRQALSWTTGPASLCAPADRNPKSALDRGQKVSPSRTAARCEQSGSVGDEASRIRHHRSATIDGRCHCFGGRRAISTIRSTSGLSWAGRLSSP